MGYYKSDRIPDTLSMAMNQSEIVIESRTFSEDALPNSGAEILDFCDCSFSSVLFSESQHTQTYFYNCDFDNCETSAFAFRDGHVRSCVFRGCRLSGCVFENLTLKNVRFEDCRMDYVHFADCRFENVTFLNCSLENGIWYAVKQKQLTLMNSILSGTEFRGCSLKGTDLSSCEIYGLRIDPEALRGSSIAPEQAVVLMPVFGVKIL